MGYSPYPPTKKKQGYNIQVLTVANMLYSKFAILATLAAATALPTICWNSWWSLADFFQITILIFGFLGPYHHSGVFHVWVPDFFWMGQPDKAILNMYNIFFLKKNLEHSTLMDLANLQKSFLGCFQRIIHIRDIVTSCRQAWYPAILPVELHAATQLNRPQKRPRSNVLRMAGLVHHLSSFTYRT